MSRIDRLLIRRVAPAEISTLEPLRGSKSHVGALLDSVDSAAELVEQLTT